jgi:glycosyltransferase involved in cell wall biosynthesis
VEKINPDVVFTNTMVIPWGAIVASMLNKPHVWFVREFGILDYDLKFFLPFHEVLKIIRDSSNIILTNSNAVRRALFGNTSEPNILTIRSYIDVPANALYEDKNVYYRRTGATKLIIMGTISEPKGQEDAILAVKELIQRRRDVELIILGYHIPWYLKKLRDLVEEERLEGYVRFLDFKENVYPIMNQADILLVCSKNEAFGRVILEAMFLKKPVIGTKSGGIPELIEEESNGLLFEPGDYKQLATKIEYLLEHREKIKEFGEKGYEFAKENFTKEKSIGKLYELLEGVKNMPNPSYSPHFAFVTRNIFAPHGWKLRRLYYTVRDKMLPPNSRLRNVVRRIFGGIISPPKHLRKESTKSIDEMSPCHPALMLLEKSTRI